MAIDVNDFFLIDLEDPNSEENPPERIQKKIKASTLLNGMTTTYADMRLLVNTDTYSSGYIKSRNIPSINDNYWMVINRGTQPFKVSGSQIKSFFQSGPDDPTLSGMITDSHSPGTPSGSKDKTILVEAIYPEDNKIRVTSGGSWSATDGSTTGDEPRDSSVTAEVSALTVSRLPAPIFTDDLPIKMVDVDGQPASYSPVTSEITNVSSSEEGVTLTFADPCPDLKFFNPGDIVQGDGITVISRDPQTRTMVVSGGNWLGSDGSSVTGDEAWNQDYVWSADTSYSGNYFGGTPANIFDGALDTTLTGRPHSFTIAFSDFPEIYNGSLKIFSASQSGETVVTTTTGSYVVGVGSMVPGWYSVPEATGKLTSVIYRASPVTADGCSLAAIEINGQLLVDTDIPGAPALQRDTFVTGPSKLGQATVNGDVNSTTFAIKESNGEWIDNTNRLGQNFYVANNEGLRETWSDFFGTQLQSWSGSTQGSGEATQGAAGFNGDLTTVYETNSCRAFGQSGYGSGWIPEATIPCTTATVHIFTDYKTNRQGFWKINDVEKTVQATQENQIDIFNIPVASDGGLKNLYWTNSTSSGAPGDSREGTGMVGVQVDGITLIDNVPLPPTLRTEYYRRLTVKNLAIRQALHAGYIEDRAVELGWIAHDKAVDDWCFSEGHIDADEFNRRRSVLQTKETRITELHELRLGLLTSEYETY